MKAGVGNTEEENELETQVELEVVAAKQKGNLCVLCYKKKNYYQGKRKKKLMFL